MEKVVSKVLNKLLGDFIENLDSEQLDISLLRGKLELQNLTLSKNLLYVLGLPFNMNYGTVKTMLVKIPWTKLSSRPLRIIISGVYAYMTPKVAKDWIESTEKENIANAKRLTLNRFEAMQEELGKDSEESNQGGFFKKYLMKIIDNVQIVLENVYIRYEHDVEDEDHFSAGIFLRKLEAITCDNEWKEKFNTDEQMTLKKINIVDFSIFFDYLGPYKLSSIFPTSVDIAFEKMVELERESKANHNYLIQPFSVETKLIIHKDGKSSKKPLMTASVTLNEVKFDMYTGQIKRIRDFANFFKNYREFKAGVARSIQLTKFTEENKEQYKKLYISWTECNSSNKKKAKVIATNLEEIEANINVQDIINFRTQILEEIHTSKLIHDKSEEINKIKRQLETKSSFSRIFSSEDSKNKKKELLSKELSLKVEELQTIVNDTTNKTASNDILDPNWVKIHLTIKLGSGDVSFYDDHTKLIYSKCNLLRLTLKKTEVTPLINFRVSDFTIYDMSETHTTYSYLLRLYKFKISLKMIPMVIIIECGKNSMNLILSTITNVLNKLKASISSSAGSGLANISKRYQEYIALGRNYLYNQMTYTLESTKEISLSIDIDPPKIKIPREYNSKKSYLIIDLGKITNSSKLITDENNVLYDSFDFRLSNFRVYLKKTRRDDNFDRNYEEINILGPFNLQTILNRPKSNLLKVNETQVTVTIPNVVMLIKYEFITFINKFKAVLAKYLPPKKPVKRQGLRNTSTTQFLLASYMENQKVAPKSFKILISNFHLIFAERREVGKLALEQIQIVAKINSDGLTTMNMGINQIYMKDLRPESKVIFLVINPVWQSGADGQRGDQFTMNMVADTRKNIVDVVMIMDELLVNFSPEFVVAMNIMKAYSSYKLELKHRSGRTFSKVDIAKASFIKASTSPFITIASPKIPELSDTEIQPEEKQYSVTEKKMNLRFSMLLHSITLNVMVNESNKHCKGLFMYLSLNLVATSNRLTKLYYLDDVLAFSQIHYKTDEISMSLSQFGVDIRPFKSFKNPQNHVISPCRLSIDAKIIKGVPPNLEYPIDKSILESTENKIFTTVRFESIALFLGMRDVRFFMKMMQEFKEHQTLLKEFSVFLMDLMFLMVMKAPAGGQQQPSVVSQKLTEKNYLGKYAINAGIDIDSFKGTLLDDSGKISRLLFNVNVSLLSFNLVPFLPKAEVEKRKMTAMSMLVIPSLKIDQKKAREDTIKKTQDVKIAYKLDGQIIFNLSYFNNQLAAWEPFIEDTKFEILVCKERSNQLIQLSNPIFLNMNITYNLIRNLGRLRAALNDKHASKTTDASVAENFNSKLGYVFQNHLDVPLELRIVVALSSFFELKSGESAIIAQSEIDQMFRRANSKSRSTVLVNDMNIPLKVEYKFHDFCSSICVDNEMKSIFTIKSEEVEFPILIHVYSTDCKRYIVFSTGILVSNGCDFRIDLQNSTNSFPLEPSTTISLPSAFAKGFSNVFAEINEQRIYLKDSGEVTHEGYYIAFQLSEYELDHGRLIVIDINRKHHLKNLLYFDLSLYTYDRAILLNPTPVSPGAETPLSIDPHSSYSLNLQDPQSTASSWVNLASLFQSAEHTTVINDSSGNSITISLVSKRFSSYQLKHPGFQKHLIDLSEHKLDEKKSKALIWLIEVYSDYVIVNKTREDLLIDEFEVKAGTLRFFSSGEKKFKLKLMEKATGWSDSFRMDTIGVAGLVKVPVEGVKDKEYLFGIKTTQAPSPLDYSCLVTFTPRFVICNYLEFPVYVKQFLQTDANILCVNTNKDFQNDIQIFNFDNKENLAVCLSKDQKNWSGPFSIDTFEDFQLKIFTEKAEDDGKLFSFARKWFIDKEGGRYIRVVVTSSDEACINVILMNPVDADFQICNNTEASVFYKQFGTEQEYKELKSGASCNWVWENHLVGKKKIQISADSSSNDSIRYSIEKVKDYVNKPFLGHKVAVKVDNATRKLTIGEVSENTQASDSKLSSNLTGIFFNKIQTKTTFAFFFKNIGLSLFDPRNTEIFFMNLQGLKLEGEQSMSQFSRLKKQTTKSIRIILKHFQLDSSDSNNALFPVVISPVQLSKDKQASDGGENIDFLMFEIELREISKPNVEGNKLDFFLATRQVENFELLLQKIQVKLNQEFIMKLIKLKDYAKLLRPTQAQKLDFSLFTTSIPALDEKKFKTMTKSYFHFVKLGVLHITITFRKGSEIPSKSIQYMFLFNLLKSVGGAFANITNSPLAFKEILIMSSFQTSNTFLSLLMKNYIRQGIVQVYKIFGSIDIIGNPLELVNKLGTGVYEFMTEPAKGLIRGPKAFAKGLGRGVKSLVSGVVGGGFESISKITGGFYNVLKTATGDQVVHRSHDEDSIGKNILHGLKDGVTDIYQGFTGIVTKPLKGAKAKGAKGFFQGMASGAAGLITSPIKLALKVGTVISSTIASTTTLLTTGKIYTYGRVRFIRHIGVKKILQSYNPQLAQAKSFLESFKDFSSQSVLYFAQFSLESSYMVKKGLNVILIVTPDWMLYVVNGELKKAVEIKKLIYMELHRYEKVYLLCFVSESLNFVVPCESLAEITSVFITINSLNSDIRVREDGFGFKRPNHFHKDLN